MIYDYSDISTLLCPAAANVLSISDNYSAIGAEAEIIIRDESGIDLDADIPDWCKQPFVFIIEYIAAGKFSNLSQEYKDRIRDNYKIAMDILKKHRSTNLPVASRTGSMQGLYE